MSFQAGLGVGPECYVSAVLFRSMCGLLELKAANTRQSCIYSLLLDQEPSNPPYTPYDLFCSINDGFDVPSDFTICEFESNVTDCGINDNGKWPLRILPSTFPQKTN
jgi:hypothetical protein